MMTIPRIICVIALGGIMLILLTSEWYPRTDPNFDGQLVAEPIGLQDIAITREDITLDLRPLADNKPVFVEATYHLDNRSGEQRLNLIFATGWRVPKKFEVLFNDLPVVRDRVPPTQLPPSWKPPDRTPGLQGSEGISYRLNREQSGRSAFTLIVPPGPQILKVRYPADPLKYWGSEPTVKWQFAYVLTPARSWTVFGGLNVTIHVPEDWNVACSPEMTREGSVFKGSFVKPPADAIALTLQAPKGDYDQFAASAGALWYSTIVGAAILCWWGGRIRGRANARIEKETGRKRNVWPAALGLSLFAGIMVFSMGILAEFGPRQTLPRSQANFSQYDINWTRNKAILVTIIVVPIAFTICQYMAVNIHREAIDEWNWKKRQGRI